MFSGTKSLQDPGFCRFDASHHLNDYLYLRILQDFRPVICQKFRPYAFPHFLFVPHQDLCDFKLCSCLLLHLVLLSFCQLIDSAADSTKPEERCLYPFSFMHMAPHPFLFSYALV